MTTLSPIYCSTISPYTILFCSTVIIIRSTYHKLIKPLTFLSNGIITAFNFAPTARTSLMIVSITGSSSVDTGANSSSIPLPPPDDIPPVWSSIGAGRLDAEVLAHAGADDDDDCPSDAIVLILLIQDTRVGGGGEKRRKIWLLHTIFKQIAF